MLKCINVRFIDEIGIFYYRIPWMHVEFFFTSFFYSEAYIPEDLRWQIMGTKSLTNSLLTGCHD